MANTIVCPSAVRTRMRWDAASILVTLARAVPSALASFMSVTDCEGTRTVIRSPFQSRVCYVVLAPSTATIVALGAFACGGVARSA